VKNVVNLDELKLEEGAKGDKFAWKTAQISQALGAKDLGYCLDVIPPGKSACPFHSHRGQEEMFLVLSGKGTLRYGAEKRAIRAGDVICCPTGGPETAHQVINDSTEELRMLSVSTKVYPDFCEYPDSGKIMAFGPGYRHMTKAGAAVDYWADEV
jgi:uncharacterized cupin superfamily protein